MRRCRQRFASQIPDLCTGDSNSVVAFGQKRALLVWQRIILPDGSSMQIDNEPASDPSGYAGLQDKVDFHTWA